MKSKANPLVSVIINNYNYGIYIAHAIDSAINQSYDNIEIIVVDDCSTDASKDTILSYKDKIIPIIYEEREKSIYPNFNQIYCVNKAFEKSNGEIICLLDSDDYFDLSKVNKVVDSFEKYQNAALVQDYFTEVDANCLPTGIVRPKLKKVNSIIDYYLEKNDIINLFAQTSALSFKRSYLEKMLPINEDEWNEVWLDVRLTRPAPLFGDVITLDAPYTYYTNHGKNDSLCLENKKILYNRLTQMYEYVNSYLELHLDKKIDPHKNVVYCILKFRASPTTRNLFLILKSLIMVLKSRIK